MPMRPQLPGQTVDFVELNNLGLLSNPPAPQRAQLASLEGGSVEGGALYGQWGVYVVRQLPDEAPVAGIPTFVEDVNIWVGAGHSGLDNEVSDYKAQPQGDAQMGFSYRGLAVAVSGDQVRVSVNYTPRPVGLRIDTVDRVTAWIAPGAPRMYRVPFQAPLNLPSGNGLPALRIPLFAQSMYFRPMLGQTYPAVASFSVYSNVVGIQAYSGTSAQPGNNAIGIPPNSRFVTFFLDPAAPPYVPGPDPIPQVAGWFDVWG